MKINIIFYENIINFVLTDIFEALNEKFAKQQENYVLGENNFESIRRLFKKLLFSHIKKIYKKCGKNDYLLIVNSCYPCNNLLLNVFKDIPENLKETISEKPQLKWVLKESDIKIDISFFNKLSDDIFIDIFNGKYTINDKVLFIQHNNLDSYQIFKIIKWVFGQVNCVNIYKQLENKPMHIEPLNWLLQESSYNKTVLNKNRALKKYAVEVKQFLQQKLNI